MELPETVGLLPQLQILTIKSSSNFSSLPRSLPNVKSLTSLDLKVEKLSELPDGIGRLSKLQSVKLVSFWTFVFAALNGLQQISTLPEDFGELSALEILHLSHLQELSHLPDSLGHLLNLRELEISYCDQLQHLPNSLTQLSSLENLRVENCSKLTAVPEGMGDGMCRLRELLLACKGLTRLPASFSRISSLEAIDIGYNKCFEGFNSFTWLRHLSLSSMPNLTSLPASLSRLAITLTLLEVVDCDELKVLPEEIGQLVMLEKLELSNLGGLECLPWSLLKLPRLKDFKVYDCMSLGKSSSMDTLVGGSSGGNNNTSECVETDMLPLP
ncbi:unnamed protein product [Closterium sp. NIES-53]